MRHQRKRFFHDSVHIDIRQLRGAGPRKIQQVVHDFARAERLLHDFFNNRMPRIVFRHLLCQHLNVIGNHGQRSVHLVRHSRRQQAERRQFLRLRHLLFHPLALRHVVEQQQPSDPLAGLAHQRRNRNVHRQQLALMLHPLLVNARNLFFAAAREGV